MLTVGRAFVGYYSLQRLRSVRALLVAKKGIASMTTTMTTARMMSLRVLGSSQHNRQRLESKAEEEAAARAMMATHKLRRSKAQHLKKRASP